MTPGGAIQAPLFDPFSGNLNSPGRFYVVIDADNNGAYEPGKDFVIEMQDATGTLDVNDFIQG